MAGEKDFDPLILPGNSHLLWSDIQMGHMAEGGGKVLLTLNP